MTKTRQSAKVEPPTRSSQAEQSEIDAILADSFPASDAPPWTLRCDVASPEGRPNAKGTPTLIGQEVP